MPGGGNNRTTGRGGGGGGGAFGMSFASDGVTEDGRPMRMATALAASASAARPEWASWPEAVSAKAALAAAQQTLSEKSDTPHLSGASWDALEVGPAPVLPAGAKHDAADAADEYVWRVPHGRTPHGAQPPPLQTRAPRVLPKRRRRRAPIPSRCRPRATAAARSPPQASGWRAISPSVRCRARSPRAASS